VAGAIAKLIMPGKDPGGFIVTILLGVAGALVGGFIGTSLGWGTVTGFNFVSMAMAVIGALLLLLIYRMLKRA
ncbi:MAG: GlsB/YeaQ/YmgE family stress response membrane protein, partial [Luteitalea sp.]|nr:GlsB/YeaQ/YmgE family stress response membrane protein [Luteitalea sp.]